MPDISHHKFKPPLPPLPPSHANVPGYAELQVTTNFSFLQSGSHPEEFVAQAKALGYRGIAVTDQNSLAGVVRAHTTAQELGMEFRVGCALKFEYSFHTAQGPCSLRVALLVYPTDRKSYGNLCRLLTIGKLRTEKSDCALTLEDFIPFHAGLVCILVPPLFEGENRAFIQRAQLSFRELCKTVSRSLSNPTLLSIALHRNYTAQSISHFETVKRIAAELKIPCVATNDACYHVPERRKLLDILTAVRHGTTLAEAGYLLHQNCERYLKDPAEMARLFRSTPEAIQRSIEILELTKGFSLSQLRYEYPNEVTPPGKTSLDYLKELTLQGARERYPSGIPQKVEKLLAEEFALIAELQYEKYFLTCYDIVKFARSCGILCQGRGAAANSSVCYCLGVTAVDPSKINLLFARFISRERNEPPDIDIDFEHERREEVMQYIYNRFGRERTGLTAAVITYRSRSAVREVGKAFGLSLSVVDGLAKLIHHWSGCVIPDEDFIRIGLNPGDPTLKAVLSFSRELKGFPRHLSQHVGGFVICEHPLCETVPILNSAMESRTIIEWDKDDIDALGMLKVDVLALGMLTALRKGLALINNRRAQNANESLLELHTIPPEDPAVYDMACAADTMGVFQIESRAQMSMLPRLKPRKFYDLVIEVAIVRPGPVQGNMVHPYLRRRAGLEKPFFPDDRVRSVIGRTLGVPIFHEQAMQLAIVLANFTPDEAERLRRAMAAWKRDKGKIATFEARIIEGMINNGYSREFAQNCFNQIKGFSEYGFPESHAASFALLVYASAWIKRYYPAEFAAALLNSQPMGFYSASQLVTDAREHGVTVLPIDVNESIWDCTIEGPHHALRLGMRLTKGLSQDDADAISAVIHSHGKFSTLHALWIATKAQYPAVKRASFEALARADAFRSMNLSARESSWELRSLPKSPAALDSLLHPQNTRLFLPVRTAQQDMFADYQATGLSLRGQPLQFIRKKLSKQGVLTTLQLRTPGIIPLKSVVSVAGLALIKQRPGTAKGVVFISLEDETGNCNLIIKPHLFEPYRKEIILGSCLIATGRLERVEAVVYVNVSHLQAIDHEVLPKDGGNIPINSYSY